ncbi:IS66-like element accessory protein TnpA [Paraburkholderia sp. A1RO-5L]|uniref:IS66-like element accessory protein TnpA n=1 Tax=unclassified Paraburkholderia TaxID=2615204 RepID=UPI003B8058F8
MQDNLDDFLPLRVTSINADGKRSFNKHDKQRLIEACLQPGVSIAGMALKAGVNANVLWRWIRNKHNARDASHGAGTSAAANVPAAFVPVVEITDTGTLVVSQRPDRPEALPEPVSPEAVRPSQRGPLPARLVAQLPNGVSLELECMSEDAALLTAMITALRGR